MFPRIYADYFPRQHSTPGLYNGSACVLCERQTEFTSTLTFFFTESTNSPRRRIRHTCSGLMPLPRISSDTGTIYRVSIKSFPDYKHLLQENYVEYIYIFLPLLKLVPKIFQQDGAPPYWGSHVLRFLDASFPNRWIGRDSPTPWPPRSPDITPPDLFL